MTTTQPHPAAASDAELLARYVATGSPDAFTALVDRYLPLIYSAALRQTRDPHLADDVTQATLILLARKAATIDPATLPGWLVRTTRYAALNAKRARARRAVHEQRAAAMTDPHHTDPSADAVSTVIDTALARLNATDRTAVVLRYLQGKSFADVAAHLHTTERAAQRRIARAVEKLRAILARQGVTPASLTAALTAQTLHPVPPAVASKALAALSSSPDAFTSLVAKGAARAMAAAKLKATAAVVASLLLIGIAAPSAYHLTTAAPPSSTTPPTPDAPRPLTGSLPPDMSAQPLATMNLADQRWIRPDGQPLTNPPVDLMPLLANTHIQGTTHVFLFRVVTPPRDATWTYSLPEATGYATATTYDAKTNTHYFAAKLAPRPGVTSITLIVRAATTPLTHNVVIPANATTPTTCSVAGAAVTFEAPLQQGDRIRIVRGPLRANSDQLFTDFYALDPAGERLSPIGITDDGKRTTYDFAGPRDHIKEFHLDSRPYNYTATYAPLPLR